MKQKHIIALCAVTTIAVLGAVAGTGAYLTHQTPQTVNTFAVGQLEAELTEPEWDKLPDEAKVLYPGKTVAKDPTACNAAESTTAAYMYLQVEIPRASVRTYTIAETAKADGSDETNQEPTSGAGVLDNGGEPHTVDLVSFQPNDGWSLLEETETEETHTFIYAYESAIAPGAQTPPLFDCVTYANVVEGDLPQGTAVDIICRLTAIQSDYVADANTPQDVWAAVTGAYFIAQASRTNTLTVGEVTFDPKEDIQNPDVPVQPGNSFMKRPYVVNTGNLPLRLRARVIFSDSAAQDACTLNYNTENWRYDETEDFWYYAKTLQPGEDCRNDALFDTVTYSESADATALNHYTLSVYFEAVQEGGTW